MVTDRTHGVHKLSLIFSLAISAVVYWAWMLVYNGRIPLTLAVAKNYLFFLEILLLGMVLGFRSKGVDRDIIDPRWTVANKRALRQVAAALFAAFVVIAAFQMKSISRLFFFSFAPILYLTLLFCHQRLPSLIARKLFRGDREERILLVGSRIKAQYLRSWLHHKQFIGFRTVGILSDDAVENVPQDFRHLGRVSDLEKAATEFGITQVILVELSIPAKVLQECIHVCERMGVRLLAVSDLEEQFRRPITLFEDDGRRFVGLRDEPLEDPLNQFFKRSLDLAISVPVTLVILPPTTLLVWLLQSMQSPGPVFFIQQRVGMQNRAFRIIKFRTMHVQNDDEARQATAGDSRTYPAGRWLRKFSLDELPQFFNVMTGQMSIVGPRPHLRQHDEIFARALNNFRLRAKVKPGITGLAQVRGFRGEVREERDIVERVKSDIYYLEHWSLALDCWIILQTAGQVFRPPRSAC